MKASIIGILGVAIFSCGPSNPKQPDVIPQTTLTQDQCDDPDADINCSFVNMPASLTSTMTIAGPNEPGEKITITGTFFKKDGVTPYPDVILYAYHTDNKGYYSKKGDEKGVLKWHGRLHGWCKTDKNGNYTIKTIRPAPYPNGKIPAHIHATVKTKSGSADWINDFVFNDDPLLNDEYLSRFSNHSGTGILTLSRTADNSWNGKRDITLNLN